MEKQSFKLIKVDNQIIKIILTKQKPQLGDYVIGVPTYNDLPYGKYKAIRSYDYLLQVLTKLKCGDAVTYAINASYMAVQIEYLIDNNNNLENLIKNQINHG